MHTRQTVSLLLRAILAAIVVSGIPRATMAQKPVEPNAGCPPEGCTFTISVEPDGQLVQRPPNSGPHTAVFNLENNGNSAGGYTLTCKALGGLTCLSVTPTGVSLGPGAFANVNVQYNVTTGGTLTLTAAHGSWTDAGSYSISAAGAGPPVVTLRNYNDSTLDRSLCLTAGAGEAGAAVCGDLVVSHSLPGYATMGRERTLTLVYSSRNAYYRPLITAAVRQPSTVTMPTAVYVELEVGGVVRNSATYSPWGNATTQIAMSYDAIGLGQPTGVYPFTLRVQNQYPSAAHTAAISGYLIVVNYYNSRYGAGMGIAGLEQLFPNQPVGQTSILWTSGDGSAKIYAPSGTNRWAAPSGAFRDTLVYNPVDSTYTRNLRHGVRVVFNRAGLHTATLSRTTQRTTFTWNLDTLKSITVPPGGATGVKYTLTYDNVTGRLDRITDPANRVLDLTITNGVLVSAKDPDGFSATFGYNADRKMTSRRTRRGFTTTYEYAKSHRLTKVTIPVGRVTGDNTVAVTDFRSWDEVGLALGSGTQFSSDTSQAYTLILGPRAGVADNGSFWVDRWGAPTKIVNPLGSTTRLVRSDPAVPALVTKVISPDNRVDSMRYNARGNLLELHTITSGVTGSTPLPAGTAKTRWTYNSANTKDSPDSIIDPENVVTRYAYDTLGITSQVTGSNGHVTQFVTVPSGTMKGLVQSVKELAITAWNPATRNEEAVATSRTGFAFNTLGNVVGDTSPMGRVRRYPRDAKQRVADLYDAAGHRTEFKYDSLNRVVTTIQHVEQAGNPGFPADPGFTTPLISSTVYNIDVVDYVVDPRTVVRRFTYDFANRQITEKDENQNIETRWFNAPGQVDSVLTRTGRVLRHEYDAAGRNKKTAWPEVLDGLGGQVAGADSIIYAYDPVGRMTSASTSWPGAASVTRTYYGTGGVRTDVENAASPIILVSQAYNYDRAGRRTAYRVGTPGIPAQKDSVAYSYDATGLRKIKVWWRTAGTAITDSVRFAWDALGRRDTVAYSSGAKFAFAYDQDGMQRMLCSTSASSAPATVDMFSSRVLQDSVDQDGMIRQINRIGATKPAGCLTTNRLSALSQANTYDNRHQLKSQVQGPQTQSYTYDGSGNIVQTIKSSGTTTTYTDSVPLFHNQLARRRQSGSNLFWEYRYNDDGSRFDENPCVTACSGPNISYRQYLYDGRNRMVGANEKQCSGVCQPVLVANCYYDPLERFLHPCENGSPNLGYDGENVVRTGSDANNNAWTFIHGPNTDDPLLARYPAASLRAFYITDGNGRQYVVADQTGTDITSRNEYSQQGGKYAGGTASASSFAADRHSSSSIPGVSFFRNRAYDQTTGRWTQEDPIGVAGGLNLYQFNGNNPVSFTDPFGLCKRPGGKGVGVCIESFIKGSFAGVGDNREASSTGGSFKTSVRFSVDPGTSEVTGYSEGVGSTNGSEGTGSFFMTAEGDGQGGTNVRVTGNALNGFMAGPEIDFDVSLNVSADGEVTVTGGRHDGFPSYEIFAYPDGGGEGKEVYTHDQGNFMELFGRGDVYVP